MAHKEKRKDVRIYLKVEECEHLKAVAKESGISLSDLIGKTVMKKFPLPKAKKNGTQMLYFVRQLPPKNLLQLKHQRQTASS